MSGRRHEARTRPAEFNPADLLTELSNPYYCLGPTLAEISVEGDLIPEDVWVKGALMAIAKVGPEAFLWALLDNLRGT